jgi:hypothetical protein
MSAQIHETMFSGSMVGSGPCVFAVWAYVIAHTNHESRVELNPMILSAVIGAPLAELDKAIETLCGPDPRSRSKEFEGRRLIKEGEFLYHVPTFERYNQPDRKGARREYFRLKKQEQRAKSVAAAPADEPKPTPAQAPEPVKVSRKSFVKPTLDEVLLLSAKAGLPDSEAEKFHAYYEANGWKVGRNPMKSWPAALTNWKLNYYNSNGHRHSRSRIADVSNDRNQFINGRTSAQDDADEAAFQARNNAELARIIAAQQ